MDQERRKKIAAGVEEILRELNGGNPGEVAEVIVQHLQQTHRTLQANWWRTMKSVIEQYAKFDTDLRNEDAVAWAQRAADAARDMYMRHI
jgi:hypothetical protein